MSVRTAAVILAAGAGTRMRSALPKPLHTLAGRPMIDYVLDAVEVGSPEQVIVVLSPALNADNNLLAHLQIRLGDRLGIAIQHETNGTGNALQCAHGLIRDVDVVTVVFADHPLLEPDSVSTLVNSLAREGIVLSLLTCQQENGGAYGRIDRDPAGKILRIVERKDDDSAARSGSIEVNTGMMAISREWLRSAIDKLTPSNSTGEFYLTQLAEIANADGCAVGSATGTDRDLTGVNDRVDLATAESLLQSALRQAHQRAGVTFVNGETATLEYGVEIATDVTIEPGCVIRTGTSIGQGSTIGPNTVLDRARIGANCRVLSSYITDSTLADGADVGPFSHIRGGTTLASGVHVGSFAEIKNSALKDDVRMGHFSYVGDATIGARTNIGAGVVTCNFDGTDKHPSIIGEDVFLGSDTMLIAPIRIGDGAVTGAGSVVTRDVAAGDRVAGVPAKPLATRHERQGKE